MSEAKSVSTVLLGLPPVLDACCGSRAMWFDKRDKRAIFVDIRNEDYGKVQDGAWLNVEPDQIANFTELPFPDNTFWHVVFDPPHMKGSEGRLKGCMGMRYGLLFPGWQEMIGRGFAECFRVLRPGGTLIFKWCEVEIPIAEVLALTPEKPLYGHRSGKASNTHWIAFMKDGERD